MAVDSKGNLYVADSGNNRILRFPAPFQQPAGNPPQPDLVIGQKGFNTGNAFNEGGNCAGKTLATSYQGNTYLSSLAIDSAGNLWTTDPVNNRVLMYPPANLSAGAVEPVATVVLGQNDFVTCNVAQTPTGSPQINKATLNVPSSLAFDSAGNLYVADGFSRVLYYQGPNFASQGQTANRVLGISPPQVQGGPATVFPNQYSLGAPNAANNLVPPQGVFTLGNHRFCGRYAIEPNRGVRYPLELGGGIDLLPVARHHGRIWPDRLLRWQIQPGSAPAQPVHGFKPPTEEPSSGRRCGSPIPATIACWVFPLPRPDSPEHR